MTEAVETINRKIDSRYTLIDKLGAGGQGEVWRAHDGTRGVDIALKVLSPTGNENEAWSALEHEYAIASRLDHPSILKVFPPERSGEAMVLPMELASGGDGRRLRGAGFLEIIPVLLEVAQALEHAHERGVVHRDLKPGNILFDARGRARLADFGVAEAAMTAIGEVATPATRDTNRHGFSPFTASPAQLRGEPPTPSDDIYGLGALAYELLSGYPPYYPHFDRKRAMGEPVPPVVPTRQIPPLLRALVMRMLEKDPKRRPRSMREVIDELDAAINDTLTFDFDSVSFATPSTATLAANATEFLPPDQIIEVASRHASQTRAGDTSDASAKPHIWTPDSGERRESNDRHGGRSENLAPRIREPTILSGSSESEGVDTDAAHNGSPTAMDRRASDGARSGDLGATDADARSRAGDAGVGSRTDTDRPSSNTRGEAERIEPDSVTAARIRQRASFEATPTRTPATRATPEATPTSARAASEATPSATRAAPEATPASVRAAPEATRSATRAAPEATPTSPRATPVATPPAARATPDAAPPASRATPRSGADALARIDAALERAAAADAAQPSKSNHPPMTPAEAAAIVAAARAAASKPAPATRTHWASTQPAAYTRPTTADHAGSAPPSQGPAPTPPPPAAPPRSSYWQQPPDANAAAPRAPAHSGARTQPMYSNPTAAVGTYPDPAPIRMTHTVHTVPMHNTWGEIPLDRLPKVARLRPIRPRRWPWVFLGLVAGAGAAVYFWVPRFDMQSLPSGMAAVVEPLKAAIAPAGSAAPTAPEASTAPTAPAATVAPTTAATATSGRADTAMQSAQASSSTNARAAVPAQTQTVGDDQRLRQLRQTFDTRLASLEARGAGVWGGREYAMAKTRAAESVGAHDAGNPRMAQERLATAMKLLDTVESRAPQAFAAQVAAGEQALGAGQQEVAGQAFDLARRINPTDRRVTDGQRRAQNLNAVLPLIADGRNAEAARDYARAAQDYSQALSLDPGNATARQGQARANAAFGDDNYAKAVGAGFASLGAGRLDEAHDAFVRARALKPGGAEAAEGLRRVSAALTARGFASMRQRAAGLEEQERWSEAERTYEDVLAADPSLAFAQEGKARTASRADLSIRLQQLIDRPDRLSTPGVRDDARALLETARAQSPQGPVIRSQIARLEALLPNFDKPVRLSLVSDNSTQVVISSIGSFGAFSRRDIELRPGKYTVVGTRNGFRDVRREITVAPGQETQTIRVTCQEPI
jgi:serine/threonine protein kinase/tetratricopeptide (TPR) repeat protein